MTGLISRKRCNPWGANIRAGPKVGQFGNAMMQVRSPPTWGGETPFPGGQHFCLHPRRRSSWTWTLPSSTTWTAAGRPSAGSTGAGGCTPTPAPSSAGVRPPAPNSTGNMPITRLSLSLTLKAAYGDMARAAGPGAFHRLCHCCPLSSALLPSFANRVSSPAVRFFLCKSRLPLMFQSPLIGGHIQAGGQLWAM